MAFCWCAIKKLLTHSQYEKAKVQKVREWLYLTFLRNPHPTKFSKTWRVVRGSWGRRVKFSFAPQEWIVTYNKWLWQCIPMDEALTLLIVRTFIILSYDKSSGSSILTRHKNKHLKYINNFMTSAQINNSSVVHSSIPWLVPPQLNTYSHWEERNNQ